MKYKDVSDFKISNSSMNNGAFGITSDGIVYVRDHELLKKSPMENK